MRRFGYSCLLVVVGIFIIQCTPKDTSIEYVDYVDPYIGSDYHGHVFVGANVPFGAVQLGPSNFNKGWDWCSAYHYSDSIVKGFSHLHLSGTGIGDLGDILVMPTVGQLKLNAGTQENPNAGYASFYSHENEKVAPGYYSVLLESYNIEVELTSSKRVGFHKYTFPKEGSRRVIVDLTEGNTDQTVKTGLTKVDNSTVTGFRFSKGWAKDQRVYFAIKTSLPFEKYSGYDFLLDGKAQGAGKAVLEFPEGKNHEILLKVGISPVSEENALENINQEIPGWDFEEIKLAAKQSWNKELGKFKVQSEDEKKLRTFYTALYHTMFAPTLFNDSNGDYLGTDKEVKENANFQNYTIFSLWDTYRAAHPLYTIFQPERVTDFINSMLAIYQQQGKLPVWHLMGNETNTMVGYHAVPVIVDAFLKGIEGFDTKLAYEAVKASAMRDERGLKDLKELGYIPADKEIESVAKALEYAIDDWCIAAMAYRLGETEDYEYFSERATYYKNYFDADTKFMRGKLTDGSWRRPFDPFASKHREDDYCEGNAWQYTWLAPHDVEGLISLFGSDKLFTEKLDSLFILESKLGHGASADISGLIGQYAHGNEPSHHISYLYAFAGQQWKTSQKVRFIMDLLYSDKPDGLSGNEDCGQMSAWYVFSSLGFYPVNPANGVYVFGSPVFEKTTIQLGEGKTFEIQAENVDNSNIYIQSVTLNGEPYHKSYITHQDIMKGGILKFEMGSNPNKEFGKAPQFRPKSVNF